jgi:hypothetical protein
MVIEGKVATDEKTSRTEGELKREVPLPAHAAGGSGHVISATCKTSQGFDWVISAGIAKTVPGFKL